MIGLALHAQIPDFEVIDGCLAMGGRSVMDWYFETHDCPPLYLYDHAMLTERVAEIKRAFPPVVKLHYAVKANPMREVVQMIGTVVDGLDVASAGELAIAIQTNVPRSEISFAGPGKTDLELRYALEQDVVVNVESANELSRLAAIASKLGKRAKVALRVNPAFELKNSGMRMSGGPKQFGIDAERIPEVLTELVGLPVDFQGFHVFCGSQNLRAEAICEAQTKSLELCLELSEHAPAPPRFFNIGGGMGIPYFPGDQRVDLASVGAHLADIVDRARGLHPLVEIVVELGRYIVGEAGVYLCQIIDRKVSRGETFLITNGGLHHHLAATGNFGQVIRKNYPVTIANRLGPDTVLERVNVVGPLCTPLDLLAQSIEAPRSEVGDLVAVFQSGAYGYSASPHSFLGHPPPRQLLV